MDSALVSLSFLLVTAVATHRHPSLITLRSAYATRAAVVAPPKSHNLIHHRHQMNPTTRHNQIYHYNHRDMNSSANGKNPVADGFGISDVPSNTF